MDILGAITNTISGFFNRHAQKESNKRNAEQNELNRQFNAEQAELDRNFQSRENQIAFDRSMRAWHEENTYNSPSNQLKRLKDAGINPNLFGGDNTAASAPSASAPSGAVASAPSSIPNSPIVFENPLAQAAQIRLANAQAESLEHDTERKDDLHTLDVQTAQSNLKLIGLQSDLTAQQKINLEQDAKIAMKRCDEIDQNISQSKEYERYMKLQGDALEKENAVLSERIQKELEILEEQKDLLIENKKEVASQIVANLSRAALDSQLKGESSERTIGLQNQNYLDGVKVQAVKDNRRHFVNLAYDEQTKSLQANIAESQARTAKSKKEERISSMRNIESNWNYVFDSMEMLSTAVGAGFRIGLSVK